MRELMLIVQRADPNHTGTISKSAFVAAALALFDQADANHDGVLTPEERRAAWAAMRPMHRRGMGGADGQAMPPPPSPQNP